MFDTDQPKLIGPQLDASEQNIEHVTVSTTHFTNSQSKSSETCIGKLKLKSILQVVRNIVVYI